MNLALYSTESAGNKDLIRSVRRTTTTELQKLVLCFMYFVLNVFYWYDRLLEAKRPPNRNNYFGTFQWNRVEMKNKEFIEIFSCFCLVKSWWSCSKNGWRCFTWSSEIVSTSWWCYNSYSWNRWWISFKDDVSSYLASRKSNNVRHYF